MIPLFNLKSLRLGFSIFSSTFASKDLKPSHFPLQIQLLCRHFRSEISETQPNFTVNYLINSCGLSPENAISASNTIKLQSPERADSVLALLRSHGFSHTQISKLVRSRPQFLLADPDQTLLPKLEFFSSIGFSREDVARIVVYSPSLLMLSLRNRIVPTYDFLRSMLSEKNVASVVKRGSWIFLEGHSKNVEPNIGILRESGMPQSCISLLLACFPRELMWKTEKFGEVVDVVKQMGFNLEKSTSAAAISTLCGNNAKSRWDRNREVYKRWGWSEDDVLTAFRRFPLCMTKSEKKIAQVMELLVNKMGWPSRMIAKYPVVMGLSLEKRVIPRCKVVKVLLLKGLVNIENLRLSAVLKPVEKKFLESFVTKYLGQVPQIACVYHGNVDIQDA